MSLAANVDEYDPPSRRDENNSAPRSSQNKPQLLEATMRNVPKLKELNYTQWKNVITNSIKKAKLWGYIDGSIEEPSEHDASNLTMYFDEAAAVRNAILGSLEPGAQKYIEEALDPREAWLALEKKYLTAEAETDKGLLSIEKQLADLRLEEGGDIIEHVAEFCRMRYQLNGTRFALDEQASISMLYRSLPPSYRQSVLTPEGMEMKDFNALCARLSHLSQNPELQVDASAAPIKDYTNWGVPEDIRAFGLTGDKNPLLEERAAVTCRDCLLKGHKAGAPECPQYEWRKELWGDPNQNASEDPDTYMMTPPAGTDTQMTSNDRVSWARTGNKKLIYQFSEPVKVLLSFDELNLGDLVNKFRLKVPFGIQQCAILPIVNGRNVIAQAPPQMGKTTTVAIVVSRLMDSHKPGIQVLIISPTEQKVADIQTMITSLGCQCHTSTSNQPFGGSLDRLVEGHKCPVLLGTPGCILQLFRRGILRTSEVKILVLDDLDILVNNGFNQQICEVYQHLPHSIQTLGTGTTLSSETLREVNRYVHNPLYITIDRDAGILQAMSHSFVIIPKLTNDEDPKLTMLYRLLRNSAVQCQVGILCDTFDEVQAIDSRFNSVSSYACVPAGCYTTNKNMAYDKYNQVIEQFRNYSSHLATTIAMPLKRTLQAWNKDKIWVINYNIPSSPQNYVERLNYLGACSGKNIAITLVNEGSNETEMIREIERYFDIRMAELSWDKGSNNLC